MRVGEEAGGIQLQASSPEARARQLNTAPTSELAQYHPQRLLLGQTHLGALVKGSRFFPQSQFQWPLWSQPQVAKDLISGEQVGGAGPEPQSQGWQKSDKDSGTL